MTRFISGYVFGIRFGYSAVRLSALVLLIVLNSSTVKVEDYYAASPYGSTKEAVSVREEEPLNDDIIISRVTRDCPDEADGTLDCSDSMHHNKESLIYPVAQFSTRRTHVPRPSTSKSSLVTASARGTDCDPDEENCEGSAVDPDEDDDDGDDDDDDEEDNEDDDDAEDKNENINMDYRPDAGRQNQSRNNKTPNTKYQHGASSKTPAAQLAGQTSRVSAQQRHQVHKPHQGSSQTGKGDADWTNRRGSTASSTPNPLSAAQSPSSNSHNTYLRNSQDVSSSSIKDRHFQQLAINMNIVLIAGIAAGIVVLLFILVVAACKFYASSTAPAGAKALTDYHQQRAANKAAYAYEACNTGGKCSSPLLVPSSQQSLPVLNATSQAGLTAVGSATSTVSKPAKKDVKEWYV